MTRLLWDGASQLHDARPRHVAAGVRNQVHEQLLAKPIDRLPSLGRGRRYANGVSRVDGKDEWTSVGIEQQGGRRPFGRRYANGARIVRPPLHGMRDFQSEQVQ